MGKPGHRRQQTGGTNEDLAIDLHQAAQRRGVQQCSYGNVGKPPSVASPQQENACRTTAEVGDSGRPSDPAHAPVESINKDEHGAEIDEIDQDLDGKSHADSLAAQQPAKNHVVDESKGSRPDSAGGIETGLFS